MVPPENARVHSPLRICCKRPGSYQIRMIKTQSFIQESIFCQEVVQNMEYRIQGGFCVRNCFYLNKTGDSIVLVIKCGIHDRIQGANRYPIFTLVRPPFLVDFVGGVPVQMQVPLSLFSNGAEVDNKDDSGARHTAAQRRNRGILALLSLTSVRLLSSPSILHLCVTPPALS
jgi:hypothetical protein